ncbi:MAG: PhoH family protein [Spirochaetaceae bacterium]|nr:PhoH family protein [Spirochaetaceae bacterium]
MGNEKVQEQKNPNLRKLFIIDTNVFIHKSDALYSFKDADVVIPMPVLEELDKLKSSSDERGRSARQAIRILDSIGKHGDLSKGVKIDNGTTVKVFVAEASAFSDYALKDIPDNKIIFTAFIFQKERERVFFVSKDINARVKAGALGIRAIDYEKQTVNINDFYSGVKIYSSGTLPNLISSEDSAPEATAPANTSPLNGNDDVKESRESMYPDNSDNLKKSLLKTRTIPWQEKLINNQYVIFTDGKDEALEKENPSVIAKYDFDSGTLKTINPVTGDVSGIKPFNTRQQIAFDILLDDSLSLVTLVGKAGTGKTLLALAAGLHKTIREKKYTKILVTRPVIPMGKDIGYLPGKKDEKMASWMQPLFDNLSHITEVITDRQEQKTIESMVKNKQIEIEALTYMRGRTLPNLYIIIDEAQNLSPHEIKTVVSRAGENTKIVLTGDPDQIDSPYLDASSNGLTYLVDAFKGQSLYGHITLEKSERSKLSELAAKLL